MIHGIHNFTYLKEQETKIFIKYNNGTEDVRQEGYNRCSFEIKQVPPLVSKWPTENSGKWHCHHRDDIPPEYCVDACTRDDFNPIVQVSKVANSVGESEIKKIIFYGEPCYRDINKT